MKFYVIDKYCNNYWSFRYYCYTWWWLQPGKLKSEGCKSKGFRLLQCNLSNK